MKTTTNILAGLLALTVAGLTARGQNWPMGKPKLGLMFQGRDSEHPLGNGAPAGPEGRPPSSYAFTTVDDPLGAGYGIAFGVEGDIIVGYYVDVVDGSVDGYVYDDRDQSWTTLDDPLAVNFSINLNIRGNDIIGIYINSDNDILSFLYDGRTWTALQDPLAAPGLSAGTWAQGIQGDKIVGYYVDAGGLNHGFLYRIHDQSWTALDAPLAGTGLGAGTICTGVHGNQIDGTYYDSSGVPHGFIYDGRTWTTFDVPLAGALGTVFNGFSGDDEVGVYADSSGVQHGFIYDGRTLTTLDDPLAATAPGLGTVPSSGDGYSIVGYYFDATGHTHGFLATPEDGGKP